MIEAMRSWRKHKATSSPVATVQEEVGLRGAGDLGVSRSSPMSRSRST